MNRRAARYLLFLAGIVTLSAVAARADDITGQEILEHIRDTYEDTRTFRAEFDHTFVWELAGTQDQMSGTFWLRKPRGFRIETPTQTVVTDGETVWSYSPATQQVILNDYRAESMPLRPDNFLFDFPDEERVTYVGDEELAGDDFHVIELVPQDSTLGIASMKVWVSPETWLARKAEYHSRDGNVTRYFLRNIEVNPSLSDETFQFTPPPRTETLDFRADAESGSR
jgi:chaperone LolA